ncbi:MAG: hypothetical protein IKI84_04275 [Clostridia bacterium]|nr:hypothetical protein [Clostridia bacterium]
MAQSAEWKSMCHELKKSVIPDLRKIGFTGSFPHLRRTREDKIELLSFLPHSNVGGAFEVGASIIFPGAAGSEESNLFYPGAEFDPKKLIWADGRIRNGLPGIFDGAFYFVDVYSKDISWTDERTHIHYSGRHYTAVTPKQSFYILNHLMANNYRLEQKADGLIYSFIAEKVASQMPELLLWFDKIKSYRNLLKFAVTRIRNPGKSLV